MLKKIAISTLFVVAVALGGVGIVAARSSVGKAGRMEVTPKAQGLCFPPGSRC
jgi:hypothetical protein